MSASRPKSKKIIPKAQPSTHPKLTPKTNKAPVVHKSPANGVRRHVPPPSAEVRSLMDKGKGKAKETSAPLSVHTITSDEDNEDDDFEEVPIPSVAGPSSPYPGTPTTNGNITAGTTPRTNTSAPSIDYDLEGYGGDSDAESGEGEDDGVIHLEIGGETAEEKAKRIALALRKKPMTSKDRAIRLEIHKMHVIALLASARVRNRWCSNTLLKARLLSLLPHPLQTAFNIPPSRFPDRAQRSRLFFDALQDLVTWWSYSFFDVSDPTLGLRTRPWDEIQEIIDQLPKLTRADLTPGHYLSTTKEKVKEREEALEKMSVGAGAEKLRSVNSMMKKALQQEGSRDISAQLFVALARACGLGARLVVSLQPVPWRAEKVVAKKKPVGAGRGGRTVASRQGMGPTTDEDEEDEDEFEEVPIPGEEEPKERKNNVRAAGTRRLQDPTDLYRLRQPKPAPQTLGRPSKPKAKQKQDLSEQPPVFWAEIFSRSDQRWIPVDPVRGIIRKKTHYEPTSDSGPIRMVYVVAYEEDGFARDVTLRYTKNFGSKISKLRVPARKDEPDWWESVMEFLTRPYLLNRDKVEDAEFETSQISEAMPQHMSGFKDHPIYVLERHLKREEIIEPKTKLAGKFRGEAVYRRENVLTCKTAETWMRVGRRVKDGQNPLKMVKQRAVTLQKRRAQELAIQETGEAIQQGLYAEKQTELYIPPPIKDGIIPQNSFGNIDLYAPTMLPAGAVHLPYKGIAKVAKTLDISYAEACTGFEFKKQRAIPVINGIVVAKENEELVMDAYAESAAAAEEKERMKKEEKALKRWAKLINGLRVRLRLQAEYGTGEQLDESSALNPLADPADAQPKTKKSAASVLAAAHQQGTAKWTERVGERSPSPKSESENEMEDVPLPVTEDVVQPETIPQTSETSEDRVEKAEDVKQIEIDSDSDLEAVQIPLPSSARTTRITLRLNGQNGNGATTKSRPSRRASVRSTRKRKVEESEEDEAQLTEEEDEVEVIEVAKSKRPTRGKGRTSTTSAKRARNKIVPTPSTEGVTRSLRSRAPKSAQQAEEEEEKRRRLQEALGEDSDFDMQ